MAELFGVDVRTVNEHLKNIFETGELSQNSTIRKFRIVQQEGSREVTRNVDFYILDAIIAVGYRVNSQQATQFRIWATKTLKEFITKGSTISHLPQIPGVLQDCNLLLIHSVFSFHKPYG